MRPHANVGIDQVEDPALQQMSPLYWADVEFAVHFLLWLSQFHNTVRAPPFSASPELEQLQLPCARAYQLAVVLGVLWELKPLTIIEDDEIINGI